MQFASHGQPLTSDGFRAATDELSVDATALWTVLAVETSGFGFFADRRPRILFERHYFHRLTNGRFDQSHPHISAPPPNGGYVGGPGEYARLEEAIALDESAALQSASWGVGQVMGENFRAAGFPDAAAMVAAAVKDEDGQLLTAARFITSKHLGSALRARDWAAFAKGYNGPKFAENQYDTKLAAAFAALSSSLPDLELRTAQAALLYLGFHPGRIDGRMGPATRTALQRFQTSRQMPVTGALNAETFAAVTLAAFPAV
jgi:hypothetical protein